MAITPEWPGDPALVPRMRSDAGWFEGVALTDEDRARTAQYAGRAQSAALRDSATDMDSYLRDLQMTLTWAPVDASGLARAVQLINKTNQFNLTTRRYTEGDVRGLLDDADTRVLQFRLTDRFVDNGVVAIAVLRKTDAASVEIDTWLMSCRVLGRRAEEATLSVLADQAREMGASRLLGRYLPTPRNGMVAGLYERLAFEAVDGHAGLYQRDLTDPGQADLSMTVTRAA
jgi:FkbH-like protein